MTGWQYDWITGWLDDRMTGWPDYWMTGWADARKLRRLLTVWYICLCKSYNCSIHLPLHSFNMRSIETILFSKIVLELSLFLTLGHGKKSDASNPHHCCSGPIILGATGAAAAKWAQYLGQYKPTKQKHKGAPVFQNQNGKYLYHHKKGQWRTNNVVNDRGVFKSVSRMAAVCISKNSKWYFWNEEWKRGNIKVSCDQDSGRKEHGRCQNHCLNN